jgi:GMP synthase (glutamine-hydrolysing)
MAVKQRVVILQMGHPPTTVQQRVGEQAQWFLEALDGMDCSITIVQPLLGEALPSPEQFDVAIISGSWSMVTDREGWSETVAAWIPGVIASGRRLLGVCYGHQLMAHALGGVVAYNPRGREVGLAPITFTDAVHADHFFADAPPAFMAHVSHEQTVLTPPAQANVLAFSEQDAHQILRYAPNALSFQFHPEFTPEIMRACIERRMETYAAEGMNVSTMLDQLAPTPYAVDLLLKFVSRK